MENLKNMFNGLVSKFNALTVKQKIIVTASTILITVSVVLPFTRPGREVYVFIKETLNISSDVNKDDEGIKINIDRVEVNDRGDEKEERKVLDFVDDFIKGISE